MKSNNPHSINIQAAHAVLSHGRERRVYEYVIMIKLGQTQSFNKVVLIQF